MPQGQLPQPEITDDGTTRCDARSLIPGGVKAEIELNGQVYTLRITRAGKLILTK